MITQWKAVSALAAGIVLISSARAADEIGIYWVSFTDTNFTTLQSVQFSPMAGSGAVNDAWFLNDDKTNFIAGGLFTKAYATDNIGGDDVIGVRVNGVAFNPPLAAVVNSLSSSGTPVNNIFRMDWNPSTVEFTFSKLSAGYNGTGDGVGATVNTLYILPGGDTIYMGGMFQSAGGWGGGHGGFASYKFGDGSGWAHLQYYPMHILGPSYAEVTDISLYGTSDIFVDGTSDVEAYVDQYGPNYTSTDNYDAVWRPSMNAFISIQ